MGIAPIPGWSLRRFCRDNGLDDDESAVLATLVRRMDAAFLDYMADKQKKESERHGKASGIRPAPSQAGKGRR